ncbi:hypothetical protein NKH18_33150 [Streptomyces sp. M10(2022)]
MERQRQGRLRHQRRTQAGARPEKLDNRDFDKFNERFRRLADRVRSVLDVPTCKVFLVIAVMGEGQLSTETEAILDEAAEEFGGYTRSIEHRVLNQTGFHRAVREDLTPEPITLTATMTQGWHSRDTPTRRIRGWWRPTNSPSGTTTTASGCTTGTSAGRWA